MPLELAICMAAAELDHEFHGYEIAKQLAEDTGRRTVSAFGTLYRALARLEAMGCVTSRWEDPASAAGERRPARRLYLLTAAGRAAMVAALAAQRKTVLRRARRKWAPA